MSDYDVLNGVLSVTKARVHGIERNVTKTGEDRRVELCPRAIVILESHLAWRASLVREGHIDHDALFFTHQFQPIPNAKYPFERWRKTLKCLPVRYRKPYTARHTSVSWNLMMGRNPLWVAKQHGHRIGTMLSVYAAWVEGARECDIAAIRRAMGDAPAPPPNRNATIVASTAKPIPTSPVAWGDFLTGAGTKFQRLTIRVRLDTSAFDVPDWKEEMPPRREPERVPQSEGKRSTGQKVATQKRPVSDKSLKGLRKTGGADGTRWAG